MGIQELEVLGLSQGEIKVYSALLSIGIATINQIHEKTGMERRAIYDIINKLIEKGLIAYLIENKKRTYHCSPISKLKDKAENMKKDISRLERAFPDIEQTYDSVKPSTSLETFRGQEGIKAVWNDMLDYKEIRWIGSGNYVPKKMPSFFEIWNERRKEKKIASYHLFRKEIKKELIKDVGSAKFLPEEFSGNPTVICVYGNKVVNFLFGTELFAFAIESKELAENYRKYHKFLWEKIGTN